MRAASIILAVALAGCGYHLAGDTIGLPDDIHSLSVGTVNNHSREYGLEKTLAFAMEREIHERGQFRMIDDGAGDAVLSGTIRDVRVRPVAFNANDQAVQYEIAVILDLALTRQHDGRVLWHASNLHEVDEYSTSGAVVITSSSQFQQGTLDAKNLDDPQFASRDPAKKPLSIPLAETERRRAIDRVLKQAVRDVYNQMVENF